MDEVINLGEPLTLPRGRELKIQCLMVEISDLIPNIFNGYPYGVSFDNTRLRVGTDTEGWRTIQMDMGRYEAIHISAAINAAIATLGWWTDSEDPGIVLSGNELIQKHVLRIDSTKLNPLHGTQVWVDLSKAGTSSDLYYSLGYDINSTFLVDGLYPSTQPPKMETQGTASVIESDISEMRRFTSGFKRVLAEVPFAGKTDFSNSVWPLGAQISPDMVYSGPRTIEKVPIRVRTRDGKPMVFMGGILSVTLRFIE